MKDIGDWQLAVSELFSMARSHRMGHKELNAQAKCRIWDILAGKSPKGKAHYNQFMQGYVAGLMYVQREALWKEMEFCYLIDGKLYTTAKEATGKEKVEQFFDGNVNLNVPRGHVWKGTNKPYYFTNPDGSYRHVLP